MTDEVQQYKRLCGMLYEALEQYADPEFYAAISFLVDRPAGDFSEDFSSDHGRPEYDRPMPGKLARETLKRVMDQFGELTITTLE